MQNETYQKNGVTYVRINKIKARNHFAKDKTIYLLQDNMTFDSLWGSACPISNEKGGDFDMIVDDFVNYNCDSERGYRVKFFIKEKDL